MVFRDRFPSQSGMTLVGMPSLEKYFVNLRPFLNCTWL